LIVFGLYFFFSLYKARSTDIETHHIKARSRDPYPFQIKDKRILISEEQGVTSGDSEVHQTLIFTLQKFSHLILWSVLLLCRAEKYYIKFDKSFSKAINVF
jgi:hypothetical protein